MYGIIIYGTTTGVIVVMKRVQDFSFGGRYGPILVQGLRDYVG